MIQALQRIFLALAAVLGWKFNPTNSKFNHFLLIKVTSTYLFSWATKDFNWANEFSASIGGFHNTLFKEGENNSTNLYIVKTKIATTLKKINNKKSDTN